MAVLVLASLALASWVGVLYVGLAVIQPLVEVLLPGASPSPDVLALAREALPALLVGWCIGFACLAVIGRGEALGPPAAGIVGGALGALAGALVLSAGPLL